jgi:hypothetical protein
MYYFELATGKTTWNHPSTPSFPAQDGGNVGQETPMTASKRPDSHQCCAVLSCLVFPPLEIFALVHSIMTYRSWNQGNYWNAVDHSRQAYTFAWWGVAIFALLR